MLEARAQGGSAVITLVMPVGARQLGMGETGIAMADDVFGTFWNPAGMAFGPLSNEWELVLPKTYRRSGVEMNREFTALATRPRSGFLLKSTVWAGAKDGLLLFNGKHWREYHEYVMEQGDQIEKIVRRYAGSGDNLDSLVKRIKVYNKIETQQDEEDLISLKLPYNLLFPGEAVTALALDNTDRLWVGTTGGLYRFDGAGWKSFDKEPGFTYLGADTASIKGADAKNAEVAAKVAALDTAAFRKLADSLAAAAPMAAAADTSKAAQTDSAKRARAVKSASDSLDRRALARTLYDSLVAQARTEIDEAVSAASDSLASRAKAEAVAAGNAGIRVPQAGRHRPHRQGQQHLDRQRGRPLRIQEDLHHPPRPDPASQPVGDGHRRPRKPGRGLRVPQGCRHRPVHARQSPAPARPSGSSSPSPTA